MPVVAIAVDLSAPSLHAMAKGTELAEALGASVVLVHAFHEPVKGFANVPSLSALGYIEYVKSQRQIQLEAARELTQKWAAALRDRGLEVEVVAQRGDPVDVILAAARDHEADWIVMGRQGLGFLRRHIVGSVTAEVTRKSQVPVVAVPFWGTEAAEP